MFHQKLTYCIFYGHKKRGSDNLPYTVFSSGVLIRYFCLSFGFFLLFLCLASTVVLLLLFNENNEIVGKIDWRSGICILPVFEKSLSAVATRID